MCQLLGMSCNVPTDICFSFSGFSRRGGGTDVHRDGWGIGFFEGDDGRGCRVFLDPTPSIESPLASVVRDYPIHSMNVVAHIRKATQGDICLQNTHPFQRELWGRYWVFAHNGNLIGFNPELSGRYLPVGNTDSERAFCFLLDTLALRFGATAPSYEHLMDTMAEIAAILRAHGPANFLLSNGRWLIAHCSTDLHYIVRRAPFNEAHLKDEDVSIDFNEVTSATDCVTVIATTPLTDNEDWQRIEPGTLILFRTGEPVETRQLDQAV